jgi:stage II sporulation protein R
MFTWKKRMVLLIIACLFVVSSLSQGKAQINIPADQPKDLQASEIIRFHVIANSDSQDDQNLKYAVRDEVLKITAPFLSKSSSLAESREMLKTMEPEIISTAQKTVKEWGRDYPISIDHGNYFFPAKSYGSIVLPSGNYEAVRIKIGKAEGANWWCILFPPICFVNVEKATSVQVDGKEPKKFTFFFARLVKNIKAKF